MYDSSRACPGSSQPRLILWRTFFSSSTRRLFLFRLARPAGPWADGTGETALTDNDKWVYWAPYWYKDGTHIIFTAADHSDPMVRPNYDLYWMNIETRKKTRLTYAPGADVLPVFSADGAWLMWTSTRDGRQAAQLYLADFVPPRE